MVYDASSSADWMVVWLRDASLLKGDVIINGDNNVMLFVEEKLELQGNLVFTVPETWKSMSSIPWTVLLIPWWMPTVTLSLRTMIWYLLRQA
jgi:hypothetical protein